MVISQILHRKHSPNSLGMIVVTLPNFQQVKAAVEHADRGEVVFFKPLPIAHVFLGINPLSGQQLELFILTTDSEIIKDWANL